jgi:hypothetical protein
MRYTSNYKNLQQELHNRNCGYGASGYKHAQHVLDLAKRLETRSVLDYGCGMQTLQKAIPFAITNYDPMIKGLDEEPEPHDLVVCSDVLEHIEPDCLDDVLRHLNEKTRKMLFVDVAQRPAKKELANGQNAHLIQETTVWWLHQLMQYFEPVSLQSYGGGFVAAFTPAVRRA